MTDIRCPKCDTLLCKDGKVIRKEHTVKQCEVVQAFDKALDKALKEAEKQ